MNEEPHAHENLVAKAQRSGDEDPEANSTSSEESLGERLKSVVPVISGTTELPGDNTASGPQSLCIYLLEPFILVLLFAYNFSCKYSESN